MRIEPGSDRCSEYWNYLLRQIRSGLACPLGLRCAARAGQRVLDQPIHQFRVGHPARFEGERIHADVGEARDRVHLVDQDAHVGAQEKIDARHGLAAKRLERAHR